MSKYIKTYVKKDLSLLFPYIPDEEPTEEEADEITAKYAIII
jgi:hypothetical protein